MRRRCSVYISGVWLLISLCVVATADYVPCADHPPVQLSPEGSILTLGPYWNASLYALQPNGTLWKNDYVSIAVDSFGEFKYTDGLKPSLDNALQMFKLQDGLCEIVVENDTLTVFDELSKQNVTLDRTSLIARAKWNNTNFTAAGRFSIFPVATQVSRIAHHDDGTSCYFNQAYGYVL